MATYYVREDHVSASDSNAGTDPEAPWLTISKANSTVAAGDTVNLEGTYLKEQIFPGTTGTSGNVITYIGFLTGCTIDYQDETSGSFLSAVRLTAISYVTIDDIEMTGCYWGGAVSGSAGGAATTDVTLQNCHIHDNDSLGTGTFSPGIEFYNINNLTIRDCTVVDNGGGETAVGGTDSGTGIAVYGNTGSDATLITGCEIARNGSDAIDYGSDAGTFTDCTIELCTIHSAYKGTAHQDGVNIQECNGLIFRYNIIYDFTQLFYFAGSAPSISNDGVNVKIYGNVFYNSGYWQFTSGTCPAIQIGALNAGSTVQNWQIFSNTFGYMGDNQGAIVINGNAATVGVGIDNLDAYNNVFFETAGDTPGDAWVVPAEATNVSIDYNCYFNCTKSDETETNSLISTDPLFVQYARHGTKNFHLQVGSPVISAGDPSLTSNVTVPASFLDIDGTVRVKDSGTMGAYEKVQASGRARPQVAFLVG